MSVSAGLPGRLGPQTRLGGAARLFLGFVFGALFAMVPMYFYMGREAGNGASDEPLAPQARPTGVSVESIQARADAQAKSFASRLTYELSRAPAELPLVALKTAPAPAAAPRVAQAQPPSTPQATPVVAEAASPPERVANARPISTVPPEPRDRTGEIEKEAQKPEYREASRPQPKAAPASVPRVFEGRAVELKPQAKPASAASVAAAAKESAAPRVEPEDRVAGVAPIKPAAKPAERSVVAKAPAANAPAAEYESAVGRAASAFDTDVESRFEATRGWLAASPPTTHTIQLMGAGSEEQLQAQLKSLGRIIEPSKLHVFRTKAQGKPSITVVYGTYVDRSSAQQALEKLPPALAANKPVLRTVNGIRAEMKQHKTGG